MNDQAGADEWLTVAESARRLGIPERSARRYAATLAATDRQMAASGRPKVRLAAMAAAVVSPRERTEGGQKGGHNRPEAANVAEEKAANGGQMAASQEAVTDLRVALAEERAARRVAEMEAKGLRDRLEDRAAEVDRLAAALAKAQETASAALARLEESERRASVMIAATATGRLSSASDRTESGESGAGGTGSRPDDRNGQNRPVEVRRGLFGWWRKDGGK